ncbi:MAG: RNA methyltransferase, partial [Opitutales bacterium]|nr:RNA methyltransferase [Opitutales bacterium]
AGGYVRELLFCPELWSERESEQTLITQLENARIPITEVSSEVFSKISLREHGDGLLALGTATALNFNNFTPSNPAFLLVTEGIEKPSNFGAIVRTAESAGVDAIIVLDQSTEIFNPNVIRNSQGAVFSMPIYHATTEAFLDFTARHHVTTFVTTPHAKRLYFEENLQHSVAILVGSESHGVSEHWLQQAHTIRIPQQGISDSLNVSAATAVVLYECVRQRWIRV